MSPEAKPPYPYDKRTQKISLSETVEQQAFQYWFDKRLLDEFGSFTR
jgi:hypothetical protein